MPVRRCARPVANNNNNNTLFPKHECLQTASRARRQPPVGSSTLVQYSREREGEAGSRQQATKCSSPVNLLG